MGWQPADRRHSGADSRTQLPYEASIGRFRRRALKPPARQGHGRRESPNHDDRSASHLSRSRCLLAVAGKASPPLIPEGNAPYWLGSDGGQCSWPWILCARTARGSPKVLRSQLPGRRGGTGRHRFGSERRRGTRKERNRDTERCHGLRASAAHAHGWTDSVCVCPRVSVRVWPYGSRASPVPS